MPTRHIGKCPVCEGDFKLVQSEVEPNEDVNSTHWRMVHHGYKRPGDGFIHGDCFAVGRQPYELSCEATKDWRVQIVSMLERHRMFLAALRSGATVELDHEFRLQLEGPLPAAIPRYYTGLYEVRSVVVRANENDPVFQRMWQQAVEDNINSSVTRIRSLEVEVARCDRLIAAWVRKPVRTIEEIEAATRAQRDVRAKEVQARRDAKVEKARALQEKRDALAAKRQVVLDEFAAKFRALAAQPVTDALKREARELAYATKQKKYDWFWTSDLKCDDALIVLGLATRDKRFFVSYHF